MEVKFYCFFLLTIVKVFDNVNGANFLKCPAPHSISENMNVEFNCADIANVVHSDYFDKKAIDISCSMLQYKKDYYGNYQSTNAEKSFTDAYKVDFKRCHLPHMPYKFFQRIGKIHEIYLDHSGIEVIDLGKFPDGCSLEILSMSYNDLMELPALLFSHTPYLRKIDFSFNRINRLDTHLFRGASKKIIDINFSHNDIGGMDPVLFTDLTELQVLDLSYNYLEHFANDLTILRGLRTLNLSNNRIVQIYCNIFSNQSLIDLTVNHIKEIDFNCSSNASLSLQISDNFLKTLTLPTSPLVNSINVLNASKNQINEIFIDSDVEKLNNLSLAYNDLTNVSDVFEHCHYLDLLDISFNNIRHLNSLSFAKIPNLRFLYLNNINLTHIDFGTFSHSRDLVTLDLSHNNLLEFNFDLFLPHFDNLTELRLNGNHLTHLDGYTEKIFPHLTTLNISSNNFNCSYLATFIRQLPKTFKLSGDSTLSTRDKDKKYIHKVSCFDKVNKSSVVSNNINHTTTSSETESIVNEMIFNSTETPIKIENDNGRSSDNESNSNSKIIMKRNEKDFNGSHIYERNDNTLNTIVYLLSFVCIVCLIFVLMKSVKIFNNCIRHKMNGIYQQENNNHDVELLNGVVSKNSENMYEQDDPST